MRLPVLSLLAVAALSLSVRADDAADARAIVKKGMQAAGIKDDDKHLLMSWKDRGTLIGGGFSMTYSGTWTYQAPDKYRSDVHGDVAGMKVHFTMVVNGKRAWEDDFGQTTELTGEKLEQILDQVHEFRVLSLAPLLHDSSLKLATAGEKEIKGETAVRIKVTSEKKPPINLYFHKQTGLLVASEMPVKNELDDWKEALEENFFENYKDVGGRKFFAKMLVVRNGKTIIEANLSDHKFLEKIDSKTFEKP